MNSSILSLLPSVWSVGLCALLFTACKNDIAEVQRFIRKDETGVERIERFEMLYSDSAKVRVKVSGATMLRYLDEAQARQEFTDGVVVEFYNDRKQVTSRMTARSAVRKEDDRVTIVRDSVIWVSTGNEILETEELIWNEKEERVYTNKFVLIRRPDEVVWGHGFESNQDFTRSRIRAIQGRLKNDEIERALGD